MYYTIKYQNKTTHIKMIKINNVFNVLGTSGK